MLPNNSAREAALYAENFRRHWASLPIAEVIKALRVGRAMDQMELSLRSGLSQPAISHLETGRTDPRWSTIKRVWGALESAPLLLPLPLAEWPRRPAQWRAFPPDLDP